MKQVNFSHPGGFPLEQETLERLQTAYRSELYEAIKSHLSILPETNYLIAHAQNGKQGWAVIHQDGEGILYPITFPITSGITNYLKTTRTTTNLIYGDGTSQKAYTDYQAEYVSTKGTPIVNDTETVNYHDLGTFKTVKSIQAIEEIIAGIDGRIKTIEATIPVIDNRVKTIETTLPTIDTRINTIKNDLESYLPLDGSKAMKGDLNLGTHHLYLNTLNAATSNDYLLAVNNQNQVVKNSTLLSSLTDRIETLEKRLATSVPAGMIAIWGKPAPFPEGWEEYVPLRGRMPVGLDTNDSSFNSLQNYGGSKTKKLEISEIPPHTHTYDKAIEGRGYQTKADKYPYGDSTSEVSGSTGEGLPFSIMNPYKVVHFIEYTGRSLTTTALTTPPNLIAQKIGATFVDLSWIPTYTNAGITNYLIYKDNDLFATINNVPFFTVNGLSRSSSYNFSVRSQDAAGNISGESNTIRIKTNLL
ncbi:fibronectin type III domain-containing protein [Flavobacterium nitrogenifigens]|uniref:Fibronectin type-III domain-containing protein n=1 Tax=Flavobacterium nitrogenifigens TaxID=1617283 RepID=A0A521FB28_9FLAO|nr:hypothetical protein [Flavobacterium nitrogenifigens]KAF2337963.1 hypothetical protein DM397_03240 [Flavobacterium nitrogenifigens]SMO93254.1 hypothetical protein SAMN06265220_10855 [Flavobacterium nitrogenifigens]